MSENICKHTGISLCRIHTRIISVHFTQKKSSRTERTIVNAIPTEHFSPATDHLLKHLTNSLYGCMVRMCASVCEHFKAIAYTEQTNVRHSISADHSTNLALHKMRNARRIRGDVEK